MYRLSYLKFLIGEICLYKYPLKLKEIKDLIFLSLEKDFLDQSLGQHENGMDGYLFGSYPITRKKPTIRFKHKKIQYIPKQYSRHFIDLNTDFENYMQMFSPKTRSTLRRKINKFRKISGGEIDFRKYSKPSELKEFFLNAKSVSKETYQEKLLESGLPSSAEFMEKISKLSTSDQFRGYLLFIDDSPIAYLCCLAINKRLRYDYLGYVTEFSKLSPGNVLQLLVIEDLLNERIFDIFDFTEGDGRHKKMFGNRSELCCDIYMLRFGLLPVVLSHFLLKSISKGIVNVLMFFNLNTKVKKMIRNYLNNN